MTNGSVTERLLGQSSETYGKQSMIVNIRRTPGSEEILDRDPYERAHLCTRNLMNAYRTRSSESAMMYVPVERSSIFEIDSGAFRYPQAFAVASSEIY